MNAAEQKRLDQRLDQHADATEVILDHIDKLQRKGRELQRANQILHRRIMVLEAAEAQTNDIGD